MPIRGGGELEFYVFEEGAYNTFDANLAKQYQNYSKLIKQVVIPILPLHTILDTYLPKNQQISFFSIDCEGLDLQVLRSNNFEKYRPKIIVVEIASKNLEDILHCETTQFLQSQGYELFQKLHISVFYKDTKAKL
ncbi:FkbM family methyltransferase [Helicobacter himalayensis]|uniref:FkbM family methyltransferase n=1 Tax=Helicobacter himalayensis TaxID=1591088 RepID=UPI003D6F56F2